MTDSIKLKKDIVDCMVRAGVPLSEDQEMILLGYLNASMYTQIPHSDDTAVDVFSEKMKNKLKEKREQGYGGWDDPAQCSIEFLANCMFEHLEKGDPVDIANFCMMMFHRVVLPEDLAKLFEIYRIEGIRKDPHWTDGHIEFYNGEYIGYDEAGLEHVRHPHRPTVVNILEEYARTLNPNYRMKK